MPRSLAPILSLMLALSVGACSRLNPTTWFSGEASPATLSPDGGYASETSDLRPLVSEVTRMSVEPMAGGVIVRATGLPPTQGYWSTALVASPTRPVDGIMTYRFVAVPPATPQPAGGALSREVTAGAFLSSYDLDTVREIVVQGVTNQRASRR